jgi:hypothetical protein
MENWLSIVMSFLEGLMKTGWSGVIDIIYPKKMFKKNIRHHGKGTPLNSV